MAITNSRGYPGLVTASDYAILSRHQGQTYAVMAHDHYDATAGTGDRGVSISTGTAIGHGVMVENTGTPVNLNANVMGSAGSRWDTVAVERDWVSKTSSLVILQGTSAKAISGARLQNVGTGKDHQPLWLIRVENGKTAIQEFVDLRVWQQDSGLYAVDPMARDYMNALGTDMLCKNGIRYIRVLDATSGMPVWSEHRAAPFGPRPTIYTVNRTPSFRMGAREDRVGWGGSVSENLMHKTGDADAHFTYSPGPYGTAGNRFVTKTPGVYSLWANMTISQSGDVSTQFLWGSAVSAPLGGLPGSVPLADAAVVGSTAADYPPGDAVRKYVLETVRYLDAGATISISARHDESVIIETWQMWAQRISD